MHDGNGRHGSGGIIYSSRRQSSVYYVRGYVFMASNDKIPKMSDPFYSHAKASALDGALLCSWSRSNFYLVQIERCAFYVNII